jgi:L-amino acid N-acyltransferase YncA
VLVRSAEQADFAAIAAITNHYIATTPIHFGYEPVTAAELFEHWDQRHPWLVIEDGGAVAGYAKSSVWRERAAYQWTCETAVYVAHATHRRGIGRTVYSALLDECARRGFHSAVAGVTVPNPASVALHERLGFVSVGTFRDAGFKHDAWHDVAWFQKMF